MLKRELLLNRTTRMAESLSLSLFFRGEFKHPVRGKMGRVDLRVSLDGAVRHSSSTGTLRKADKRTVSKTWTPSPLRDPDHPWWDGGEGSGARCGRKAKVEKWRCL